MKIVSDSSPIIGLAKIGRLNFLKRLVDFLETDLPVNISEARLPAPSQGVLFRVEHVFEEVSLDG